MFSALTLPVKSVAERTPDLRGKTRNFSFRVFADLTSVEERVGQWNEWNLVSSSDAPFVCWDWYLNWLRHFEASYDEIVFLETHLSVEEAPEDTCVFPMVRKGRLLELAGYNLGDFQDARSNEPARIADFVDLLLYFAHTHNLILSFSKVPDHGSLKSELICRAERANAPRVVSPLGPCPYFSIEGNGLEDVLTRFGKSTRKGIRRRLRNFEENIGIDFRVEAGISEEFLATASDIHRKLQIQKPGASIFDDNSIQTFLKSVSGSPEVGLTSSMLRDGSGTPIAFEIGFLAGDTYFAWVSAYDPDYSDHRPGTCAMASLIDHLSRAGVKTFDLLCGAELYKYQYADGEHYIHSLRIFPNSPSNHLLAGILRLAHQSRASLKSLAIRSGLYRPNYRV